MTDAMTSAIPLQEPSLADIARDLWRAKFALIIGTVMGGLLAFIFLTLAIPQYKAQMLIGPAERSGGVDIKELLPKNSSFAVQYFLNTLGSQDSTDFIRFENIMREQTVAAHLMNDPRIIEGVKKDRMFTIEGQNKPDSPAKFADYLEKALKIEPVGTSPLRRLVYSHPDPTFARYMLTQIHVVTDGMIKDEIKAMTKKRMDYLHSALEQVTHPDHRQALTNMLMEQEHLRMIMAIDEPFAAIIAEPASTGPKPQWPRASLIFPAFILAGMLAAYILRSLIRALKP